MNSKYRFVPLSMTVALLLLAACGKHPSKGRKTGSAWTFGAWRTCFPFWKTRPG